MPNMRDAVELAQRGWQVLPLRGKVPVTKHGVKDASSDVDQVRTWWRSRNHNIGARVPSQLVVLDIDPQNGGSVELIEGAAGTALPVTLTVHSGRGTGGRHLYYQHPGGRLTNRNLPAGVDVKTEHGYCVMPPSIHPATGQPYRWEIHPTVPLPPELIALIREQPRRQYRPPAAPTGPLAARLQHLTRYVAQLPEGNRNARLFWAACRAAEDGHPAAAFTDLLHAAQAAGLPEWEARRTIDSAIREVGRA